MTRDLDLIRNILFQFEKARAGEPIQQLMVEEGINEAVVGEHIELLIDAGLVDGRVLSCDPLSFVVKRLTWQGHDFIAKAKNEGIWNKVKEQAKAKGISLTIDLAGKMLTKAVESSLGIS